MESEEVAKQNLQHLYLAERKIPLSGRHRYLYYYSWRSGESGVFPYECVSMEYLCGYIDGTITLRGETLKVSNGIPKEYYSNWRFKIKPLSPKSIEELIEKSTLSTHYSEFRE